MKTGQCHAEQCNILWRRQPVGFNPVHIDDCADTPGSSRSGVQYANTTGFNHPRNRFRTGCQKIFALSRDNGPVICQEISTQRHQLEGKRRFSAAGSAQYQKRTVINDNGTGMQGFRPRRVTDERISPQGSDRQAHDKARAQRIRCDVCFCRTNVLGPDNASMCFYDLFGDGQSEARIVAEMLVRAL